MCNALVGRMMEEALVTKEIHDATLRTRHNLAKILQIDAPAPPEPPGLPELPVPGQFQKRQELPVPGQFRDPSRNYVPTEVMAVGDPTREDRSRPIAPYIPPTEPQPGANPFPTLNRPLGG